MRGIFISLQLKLIITSYYIVLAYIILSIADDNCYGLQRQGLSIYSGGKTTATKGFSPKNAFSQPSANLPIHRLADFFIGDSLFARMWISSSSSVKSSDGLGPMFSARSCQSCHIKDARGHLRVSEDDKDTPVVIKLGMSTVHQHHLEIKPDPIYGKVFHLLATPSVKAEGEIKIIHKQYQTYLGKKHQKIVTLSKPMVKFINLNYHQINPATHHSLVVAPMMIGLGLIEAIDAQDILSRSDPNDLNKDQISGRPSIVKTLACDYMPNSKKNKNIQSSLEAITMLGRFGWKAHNPCLNQQNLDAFFNDMSMTSIIHKNPSGDCSPFQNKCYHHINDPSKTTKNHINNSEYDPDISQKISELILFYTQSLAPPARNIPKDPKLQKMVLEGEKLFYTIGCESCHRAHYTTGDDHPNDYLRNQKIYPYSDFLLHDMGAGLDDGLNTSNAQSSEWRTTPLWGLGYTQKINPRAGYLHDGRAHTIEQAILWHSGEGQKSKDRYRFLSSQDRQNILAFLNSL